MGRLLRALRIRPGEGPLAARFLAFNVVLWTSFAIGGNAVESLLLARVGARALPAMYVALAVTTLAVMTLAGRVSRLDPRRAVPVVFLVIAGGVAGLRPLLGLDAPGGYRAAWLGMMVLWTFAGLSGWTLAGAVHDTRQAKRLFPLYGAGLVVGLVLGGFLTGPLASALGPPQLVFVWSGGTAVAAVLARSAARRSGPAPAPSGTARPGLGAGARAVARSELLRWMATAVALFALLFFALTFLFARAVAARFPEAERLAGFLGAFSGAATAAALAVSLLVANRLYARVGTVNAVLALAVLYLVGFGALAGASTFAVVVGLRFAQIVWVNGVWAPGWQSMFNVVPASRRPAVRAFMDAVPLQAGVAGAGGLLLLANRTLSPRGVALVGAGAAGVAVACMLRARAAYVHALAEALREGYPEVFAKGGSAADRSAMTAALAAMGDADPSRRRLAVEVLGASPGLEASAALEAALADPDRAVQGTALRALAVHGEPLRETSALAAFLDGGDPGLRAGAAAVLSRAAPDGDGRRVLQEMLSAGGADRAAAARALASVGWPVAEALPALADPDPEVRRAATDALGAAGEAAVPALLEALDDPGREDAALEALSSLPWGRPDPLLAYARDRARTASRFASLARTFSGDDAVPAERLLRLALDQRSRRTLSLALRAVGRRRPDVVGPAIDNLWRADGDQRANAIEAVDSMGAPDVARLLSGVWEAEGSARTAVAALTELLRDPDPWLRACAAIVAAGSADRAVLAPALGRVAGSDAEAFVREAASRALGGGADVETLATVSLMDRAVVLSSVPLFAALESADLRQVAEAAVEHRFDDGEVIGEQGEAGDALHVVVSGEVGVVVDGRPVAVRRQGEHVGEMSLMGGEPRMASLVARGTVRTLGLDRPRFERILRERPEVALAVIRVLAERLRESSRPA